MCLGASLEAPCPSHPIESVTHWHSLTGLLGGQALQSRWNTQRLGAFGSLLGDKAAEVTAMAQQSLGDSASLHSAFTNAFSHLQGTAPSAGGLLSSLRGLKGPSSFSTPAS